MVIGRECGKKQRQRALFPFILPYKNFRKGLTRYFVFLQRISFAIFIYVPVIFERFYRRRKNKMKLFLHYLSSYWTIIASDYYRAFIDLISRRKAYSTSYFSINWWSPVWSYLNFIRACTVRVFQEYWLWISRKKIPRKQSQVFLLIGNIRT